MSGVSHDWKRRPLVEETIFDVEKMGFCSLD